MLVFEMLTVNKFMFDLFQFKFLISIGIWWLFFQKVLLAFKLLVGTVLKGLGRYGYGIRLVKLAQLV